MKYLFQKEKKRKEQIYTFFNVILEAQFWALPMEPGYGLFAPGPFLPTELTFSGCLLCPRPGQGVLLMQSHLILVTAL